MYYRNTRHHPAKHCVATGHNNIIRQRESHFTSFILMVFTISSSPSHVTSCFLTLPVSAVTRVTDISNVMPPVVSPGLG